MLQRGLYPMRQRSLAMFEAASSTHSSSSAPFLENNRFRRVGNSAWRLSWIITSNLFRPFNFGLIVIDFSVPSDSGWQHNPCISSWSILNLPELNLCFTTCSVTWGYASTASLFSSPSPCVSFPCRHHNASSKSRPLRFPCKLQRVHHQAPRISSPCPPCPTPWWLA